MIENKNIPELRFPGFTGEWEEKKLGEVNAVNKTNKLPESFYYIDLESVNEGTVDNNLSYYKLNCAPSRAKRLLKKDDILYSTVRPYQNNNLYINFELDKPMVASTGFALLRPKIDSKFQYYYLYNYNFTVKVLKRCTGTSYPAISSSDLSEIEIKKPSLPEQEKIGSFFYTLDQKLELQKKKIEELKAYKKGMMQRIFDQEIRFKDEKGQDYPDWEEKRLGEVIVEINKRRDRDDLKILSSTIDGVYYQEEYFKNRIASNDTSNYKILTKNQIVFSPQNIWMGNINFNDSIEEGIVSPSYKIFEVINEVNDLYIKYLIKTPKMLYEYKVSSEQGASVVRRNLNMTLFKNIKINLPSFPEQEKIASLLSGIDKKIELEEERLGSYEEFKKGLMQRMFV